MQERDAIWLAGVLDARGTLTFVWKRLRRYPRITLAAKDRALIERVQGVAGCGLVEEMALNGGVSWRWRTNSQESKLIAHAVLPYMRVRAAEVAALCGAVA